MDANPVVIDNAFNSVEDSKTEQHCPDQEFRQPVEMPAVRRAPKQEQTDQNKKVWRAVKDAVPSRVEFQVLDGVDGVPTAEHVMPLHLMQHDAIEEPPNPRSKKMPAAIGKWRLVGMAVMVIGPTAIQRVVPVSLICFALAFARFLTSSRTPVTTYQTRRPRSFLPWPYATFHGFRTHQAPAPRAVIMHCS